MLLLSQEEMETIVALLQEIAQQSYDIEQMKETLKTSRIWIKKLQMILFLTGTAQDDGVVDAEDDNLVDEDSTDGEDITQNVDPDVLGEDIKKAPQRIRLFRKKPWEAVEGEDAQLMKKQESLKLQRTEPLLTEQPRMIWL